MKNVHVLPTNNSSRLSIKDGVLILHRQQWRKGTQHIYITSDEEEAYPYALHIKKQEVLKINGIGENSKELFHDKGFNYQYECKKIILTTDQDLIKDGVQAIDNEFLEWFVKNPSCEDVETTYGLFNTMGRQVDPNNLGQNHSQCVWKYKIIVPKEEPKQELPIVNGRYGCIIQTKKQESKQETLEKAALKYASEKLQRVIIPYKELNANVAEYVGFVNGAKWQQERMYNEEEVIAILENFSSTFDLITITPKQWFEQFKNK